MANAGAYMKQAVVGGVIAALFCCASSAHAERYVIPYIGDDAGHVIDLDTVRKKGPITRFWSYSIWRHPETVQNGSEQWDEMRSLHEVNCEAEEQRTVQYSIYFKDSLAHDAGLTGEGWTAVTPLTVISVLFRTVCAMGDPDLKELDSMDAVHRALDGTWAMRDASR